MGSSKQQNDNENWFSQGEDEFWKRWLDQGNQFKQTLPASIMFQYAFEEIIRQVDMSETWEWVTE